MSHSLVQVKRSPFHEAEAVFRRRLLEGAKAKGLVSGYYNYEVH